MSEVVFEPFDFKGDLNPDSFKRFMVHAYERGASDVLLQGGDVPWVEIYGRQRRGGNITVKQGQLSALLAGVWGADVEGAIRSGEGADRPLELFGEELGIKRGKRLRARCNFVQARVAQLDQAYAITMRMIPTELPDLLRMNLPPELFAALYPAKGLVLVCGPTGSGKTTLQAGVYGYAGIVMPDRKVVTYEDPVEFVLGGEHWKGPQPAQSQIGRDIPNFAAGLRNAMRRKPSIIGIGEVRDLETVDAAIEAGLTGHLCYATAHTDSVAETINRLIQVYPPASQAAIASRLIGVAAIDRRAALAQDRRWQAKGDSRVRDFRSGASQFPPGSSVRGLGEAHPAETGSRQCDLGRSGMGPSPRRRNRSRGIHRTRGA